MILHKKKSIYPSDSINNSAITPLRCYAFAPYIYGTIFAQTE